MKSVAIIGGGITGLTAAFQLRKQGIPVTLYEAGARVGGPIQTVREEGYLAERGPNTILETTPLLSELVRELGLEPRRRYSSPAADKRYIAKNGRPVPLPGSPGAFLSSPLFSGRAKLRLGLEPFIRRSDPGLEESIGQFVVRRLGSEFLDYAINPMVGGIYAGDPSQLSVRQAFPKLHALEQRYGSLIAGQILGARERRRKGTVSKQNAPKVSFDEGLEVLIKALQGHLQDSIFLGQSIRELSFSGNAWKAARTAGANAAREHSAVILAIPAHALARIRLRGVSGPDLRPLEEIYYPPVASVVLGFRREDVRHPLDGFGVLVPEAERMNILGTLFSSTLFDGRAPAGHVALTTYLGGSRAPELALAGEDQIIKVVLGDLQRLLGVNGSPTYRTCFVFKQAIPQYNIGFGRFKELMSATEASAPGLFIGGQCRCGISVGDSIASGGELAAKVRQYLAQSEQETRVPSEYAPAA